MDLTDGMRNNRVQAHDAKVNVNREGIAATSAQNRAHLVQSANTFVCGDETTDFSKDSKMWKCVINICVFVAERKNRSSTHMDIKKNLFCEIRESVTYWIATSRQKGSKNSFFRWSNLAPHTTVSKQIGDPRRPKGSENLKTASDFRIRAHLVYK